MTFFSKNLVSCTLQPWFASGVEQYAYGLDIKLLDLKGNNVYVTDVKSETKQFDNANIFCFFFLQRFEDPMNELINSDASHQHFLSLFLSVCFLEPEIGKLPYPSHGDIIRELAMNWEFEIDVKMKKTIKKCINGRMVDREGVMIIDPLKCRNKVYCASCVFYKQMKRKKVEDLIY